MIASDTDICNRALSKLGGARIASLEDTGKAATLLRSMFDNIRDDELSNKPWNFAMKRDTLPALDTAPAWGYGYAYAIPTDCLRLVQINDTDLSQELIDYRSAPSPGYAIENGQILTDWPAPLKVRYVQRFEDYAKMDATFVEAFATRLAIECCEAILQSPQKKQLLMSEYARISQQAAQNNAVERAPEAAADDSWVLSRL